MADRSRFNLQTSPCAIPVALWAALITVSYVAGLLFITFPQIDIFASAQFAAPDGQGFPLAQRAGLRFLNELVPALAWMAAGFIVTGLLVTGLGKRSFLTLKLRQMWFLALSFGVGPGLFANTLLKDNWGRARPRDVTQFGGALDFSPPLLFSDQCASNCSFVSGDASLAFTFLALALIIPKRRFLAVNAALLFGAVISAARLIQGAHFLSDVLFAGLFMTLIVISLHKAIIEWPGPRWKWLKSFKPPPRTHTPNAPRLTIRRALWLMFRAKPEDL